MNKYGRKSGPYIAGRDEGGGGGVARGGLHTPGQLNKVFLP